MNAGTVSVVQASSVHYNGAATASVRRTPGLTTTSSTLPIARCRVVALPRPVEPYYNDFASTGMKLQHNDDISNSRLRLIHIVTVKAKSVHICSGVVIWQSFSLR